MANPSDRSRRTDWSDPAAAAANLEEMSGLEYLSAIAEGRVPEAPMWRLQGFTVTEVEAGRIVFEGDTGEHLYNPIASVHGGYVATLIDTAASCAIHTMLPKGDNYTTIALAVDLVRGLSADSGRVRCEGRAVRVGRRVAVADAEVTDAAGKMIARGSVNCIVFRDDAKGGK